MAVHDVVLPGERGGESYHGQQHGHRRSYGLLGVQGRNCRTQIRGENNVCGRGGASIQADVLPLSEQSARL